MARRLLRLVAALAGGVALLLPFTSARASVGLPSTLDDKLLHADAIFFATISMVDTVPGREGRTELTLTDHRRITSRWQQLPDRIRVVGTVRDADGRPGVRPHSVYEDLVQGGRYLFLLQGGHWRNTPFNTIGKAVFPVRGDEVKCHGGAVYGLTPTGFLCSRRSVQVGDPLSESALGRRLVEALRDARRRRPTLARNYDRASEPFVLEAGIER